MTNEQTILEIKKLFYRYDKDNVLENINLVVKKGSFVGIVGPNGSGKSTLVKLILRLLKLQKGEILLFNEQASHFKKWEKIGFVSQKASSFNTGFPATVFEVVASGLTKKLGLFRRLNKNDVQKVHKVINEVGMEQFTHRNIGELSGGQQQRVFIARALVCKPQLLILDEPTVGVDIENVQSFYELLAKLNKQLNLTLLVITHDIASITDKLTELVFLNKQIMYKGSVEMFKDESFAHYVQYFNNVDNSIARFNKSAERIER